MAGYIALGLIALVAVIAILVWLADAFLSRMPYR